ncbi:hypothetical protein [Streptomyces sp. RPT161]|uniref:hypothetical protein n=1 Tax=Streptomyces sp. RPT161 TaxID=3015993 RepID=UPI0022B8E87C|nr:hypothetical protein [Streptomyces sp. RPT161]
MTSNIARLVPSTTGTTASLVEPLEPVSTSASQLGELAEAAGSLRYQTKKAAETTTELHKNLLFHDWQLRTNQRGRLAPKTLLEQIADLGFAWRDVARMIGVSVPAVQKWRRAGGVTGENRRRLASLLAMCDLIMEKYMIQEAASWFEMPISASAPVTPIDLYSDGHPDLVLEHANGHSDAEQILTAYDPEWREQYRSSFEVYLDHDGEMSIRPKDA